MSGIIGKIRKLLELADENNGGTEGEREAAATKAAQLMAEHRVTEAELIAAGNSEPERIEERQVIVIPGGENNRWQEQLVTVLAGTVDCEVILIYLEPPGTPKRKVHVKVVGRSSSIDYVQLMYGWIQPQLVRSVIRAADQESSKWTRHEIPAPTKHMALFRRSYLYGMVHRIFDRLQAAQSDIVAGTDVVLSDRQAVDRFLKSAYGDELKRNHTETEVDREFERLGAIAGEMVDLTPGNKLGADVGRQLGVGA